MRSITTLITLILLIGAAMAEGKKIIIDKEKWNLSEAEWKKRLTPEEYQVLRGEGTEKCFVSGYLEEKRPGTYACRACGLPLFESKVKYTSGTGWPSFWQPIEGHIETKPDYKLAMPRTEYHCAQCGSHQGHVFEDGPPPTGLRYCNNGISLKFIAD